MTTTNRDFIAELDAAIGCQQCGSPLGDSPSDDFCTPDCQAAWSAARTAPLASYSEPDEQAAHVSNLVELHSPETCAACVDGRHSANPRWLDEVAFIHDWAARRRANARRADTFRRLYLNGLMQTAPGVPTPPPIAGQVFVSDVGEAPDLASPNWRELGQPIVPVAIGFDPATENGSGSIAVVTRRDRVDYVEAIISPGGFLLPSHLVEQMRTVAEEVGQAWADAWRDIGEALVPLGEQLERAGLIEERPPDDPRERALWLRQHRNTGPAVSARAPRAINPRRGR